MHSAQYMYRYCVPARFESIGTNQSQQGLCVDVRSVAPFLLSSPVIIIIIQNPFSPLSPITDPPFTHIPYHIIVHLGSVVAFFCIINHTLSLDGVCLALSLISILFRYVLYDDSRSSCCFDTCHPVSGRHDHWLRPRYSNRILRLIFWACT